MQQCHTDFEIHQLNFEKKLRQAGAELCQAQISFRLATKPSRIWNLTCKVILMK